VNRIETIALTRYVQALCPAQKLDQYSADAWHDVLGDLPLGLAKKAAAMCARQKPFVAPSEIVAAAIRLRRAVRAQIDKEAKEANPPDGGAEYVQWRRKQSAELTAEADRQIADNVYDLTSVDLTEDLSSPGAMFGSHHTLTRIDGRREIEPPRRIEDEPTVPLAEVLARARAIRDANREQAPAEDATA